MSYFVIKKQKALFKDKKKCYPACPHIVDFRAKLPEPGTVSQVPFPGAAVEARAADGGRSRPHGGPSEAGRCWAPATPAGQTGPGK